MSGSPLPGPADLLLSAPSGSFPAAPPSPAAPPVQRGAPQGGGMKPNQVGQVVLYGVPIVSLVIDGQERLCLAQISNTLLKSFSYNEIHNRRVALGITCVQCTPVQLEILRRAGAMPISSRRCGMITKREAERLCKSFLGENRPPKLPDNFAFDVAHECAWGSRGSFVPARYNSSRAKCIKCAFCSLYFSPNKFIFHSHRTPDAKYTQPDAANFNSWRRHLRLSERSPPDELVFAWEDVKAMFNGGSRKRALPSAAPPAPHCHPLKVSAGLLAPPLLGAPPPPPPDLPHKRGRFEEEEELQEAGASGKAPRSYPLIPVPSKGSSFLQKFPGCGGLFPHPYGFPAAAFGLCHKKEDSDGVGAVGQGTPKAGLSGLFWPSSRKDAATAAAAAAAFYPPFCMFWPPRTPGALPGLPPYLQPPPQPPLDSPSLLRQAFLDLTEPGSGSGEGGAPGLGTPPTAAAPQAGGGPGREHPRGFDGGPPDVACSPGVAEGGGPRGSAAPQPHLLEGQPRGKGASSSYHHSSAFRPVGGKEDSESLAKLHHHHQPRSSASPPPLLLLPSEAEQGGCGDRPHRPAGHRLLSPGGTSCSLPSENSSEEEEEEEEEETEVDVEGHRQPEEEEEEEEEEEDGGGLSLVDPVGGNSRYLQSRGLTDKGVDRATAPTGPFPGVSHEEEKAVPPTSEQLLPLPPALPICTPKGGNSPTHHPSVQESPPYKDIQKNKDGNQVVLPGKEDNFTGKKPRRSKSQSEEKQRPQFYDHRFRTSRRRLLEEYNRENKRKKRCSGGNITSRNQQLSPTVKSSSGGSCVVGNGEEEEGEPIQETNSPHSLKKDVENMGKEELQKVLFEQIDLRRRLEQEFQVLKGTASFPVFNNFQDQMKRELAYREEMVQQLQIIPYAASLIRKEKLGTHLSKS